MRNLNYASAFSTKSPYEIYQEWEGIPAYKDFIVPDLLKLELGSWDRTGGKAAFVNMDGTGGTCDTIVEEIAPGGQLKAVRHMYEKAVFILQGQGATTIWNEGGKKHTLEWQRGSLFSTPLNAWHQHFNAQGSEPARYLALKPWGFKFKVEDLRDTGEDVKKGGAQIEYEDQDSEIHKLFVRECETRGAQPRMAMFGT